VSLHGVGSVSGFWEASSRLLAGRLPSTPGVRRSPSPVFFFLRVDNSTIRIFILLLLFVLASSLLLAPDARDFVSYRSASVESHIYVSCYWFFLIVGINLCIAKSLLFPTRFSVNQVDIQI
jgi:hypothetical protein